MLELKDLSFKGLMTLDESRVERLLMLHLEHIAKDIDNRPHETGKRKLIMEFTFTPLKTINNEPSDRVNCGIDVKTKTPIWRTSEYSMRITRKTRKNGQTQMGFAFNDGDADNVDQSTMFKGDGVDSE